MKKLFVITLLVHFLIFSASFASRADVVELADGSKIYGSIEKFDQQSLQIKTDFAGMITIDLKHVVRFSSDKSFNIAIDEQKRLSGNIVWSQEEIKITQPDGGVFVTSEKPKAAWREGIRDPFKRHWNFEVGFDLAGKTGNTEKISVGGKAQAKLKGPDDTFLLYLNSAYAKDDGVNSDNYINGGADFEKYFFKRHSIYARTKLEHDRIKGYDFSATAALGYGYYFIKEANHTFRGRTGLLYRYDVFIDDRTDSNTGIDFGLSHMYQLNSRLKLLNEVVYTPSIENYLDYRIYHESSLVIPLRNSGMWKLQVGVSNDYNSMPVEDKDYLDTSYFTRLLFHW